jgi:hypothetical protein
MAIIEKKNLKTECNSLLEADGTTEHLEHAL